ncbi:MAG TPA: hypothetical protein VEK35_09805 [Roseiarcus sp.]|nr:hypothetical protein [Roseiarcus sp.]
MKSRLFLLTLVGAALVATPVLADDQSPPSAAAAERDKAQVHPKSAKPPAAPASAQDVPDSIDFSQPYGSPLAPKGAKPAAAPEARPAAKEPQGGVALDLKWRATNDKVDPYDAVRHTSGPDGQGDAVEGGVKLGF